MALGGGGLISGVGLYLKAVRPGVEVVACSPARDPCMHLSMLAGKIVDNPHNDTLSEATAGGIEEDALTLATCKAVVDLSLTVGEAEIAKAMREAHEQLDIQIEGSAGVALAACIADTERRGDKAAVVIVCGGNIARGKFDEIVEEAGTFSDAE